MLLPLLFLPGLLLAEDSGLAIVGGTYGFGMACNASEFWSPAPGEVHCDLPAPTILGGTPSLDVWEGQLIMCGGATCEYLTPTGWQLWRHTRHFRQGHTSAITSQGLLLAGGYESPTSTEYLPWNGGDSIEGFPLYSHGFSYYHCSITTSTDTIVLTGGTAPDDMIQGSTSVTEYSNLASEDPNDITTRSLPPLPQGRFSHACASYRVDNVQMIMVTGGFWRVGNEILASTEVLALTGPEAGSWREAGSLPYYGLHGLRAGVVNDIIHVVGGILEGYQSTGISRWDSITESWTYVGTKVTPRMNSGVTEVPLAAVANFCKAN